MENAMIKVNKLQFLMFIPIVIRGVFHFINYCFLFLNCWLEKVTSNSFQNTLKHEKKDF